METFVLVLLSIVVLVTLFIKDISGISVCGLPKSDEVYLDIIKKMKEKDIEYIGKCNGPGFISTFSDLPFISRSITGLTFKYYVSGYGVVPKWYKSHKEITKIFNQLDK